VTTVSKRGLASVRAAPAPPLLLDHKLEIPRPTFPVLPRPHLIERLDHATGHRLTLLCAPPGAGKTVTCAAWATAAAERHAVAWLTVDRADNEPSRFWAHVVAALAGSQDRTGVVPAHGTLEPGALGDDFFVRLI
jgi:ATP/maltotriose-dependent transcriptional regulator MalT